MKFFDNDYAKSKTFFDNGTKRVRDQNDPLIFVKKSKVFIIGNQNSMYILRIHAKPEQKFTKTYISFCSSRPAMASVEAVTASLCPTT